jgi:hypothetical protein
VAIAVLAVISRELGNNSRNSNAKWIDPKKLEPGPIRNVDLTPDQMDRVRRLQKTFSEVDSSPLDKWVEDFKRDADPEPEIRIWENMATAYQTFTSTNNLTLDGKKEVYQVTLLRSAAPEDEVLKHITLKVLTEKDAKVIMSLYSAKPEPVKVVSP